MRVSRAFIAAAIAAVTILAGSLVWASSGKSDSNAKAGCCSTGSTVQCCPNGGCCGG
jgi:hypothetical protein